jgi:demethylmenaquinone methyltransferase/2-methoxy-6-polyprenyl-1,4-benzoquinol methylase
MELHAAASQQHALKTVATYQRIAPSYDRVSPVASALLLGFQANLGLDRALERVEIRPGDHVLDVCCGTGRLCQALAPAALPEGTVTGLDLSRQMLEVARGKNLLPQVRFALGNAERLPFSSDGFDRVCCALSLHEMPAAVRRNVLAEMRRVTRPYGHVYLLDWHLPHTLLRGLLLQLLIRLSLRTAIGVEFLTGGLAGEVTRAGFAVEDYATFAGGGLQLVAARKV